MLLSALVVSYDEVLSHASWLALGLLGMSAAIAVILGYSNVLDGVGIFLPLTDAQGVPVEVRFSLTPLSRKR